MGSEERVRVAWWAWVAWCCVGVVVSFNIETEHFVTHTGPPGSKFGFSVAQHRDTLSSWVLVGAPEAQTSQPDIEKGGAVYKCHPATSELCHQINFDETGNHWESGRQMDNKSMQWFGASVTSKSGVIVACAPRYVWFSVKKNRRDPVGYCFISTGQEARSYEMYSPCMTTSWGYHRQGSCQAGFGTTLTQNGNRVYVGAVGSFYWQGQVFYRDLLNRQDSLSTGEGPQRDDMSYLGYSMASGDFTGDGEDDLVVGMPRGNDLMGKVLVLDDRLRVQYNITGDQVGSYFGYSLAVGDMNGDGLADVAVGAPWYTDPHNTQDYEVGMVSVFSQTPQHNFQVKAKLLGVRSRSHFGVSVACLGDINRDGYDDLAVGAPRDGPRGSGSVYIFLGGPEGLVKEPSQVLLSESLLEGSSVRTFGWSLAAGEDLDGNEYPDLVVGAHDTDAAYVFRTRPVVQVNGTIKFKSESGIIDLEVRRCSLQDASEAPCVSLQYCLSYTGHRVPNTLQMQVGVRLDTKSELSPRMFFLHRERQASDNITMDLRKAVENCTTVYTYLLPEPRDKLTPLVAQMVSRLVDGTGVVPPNQLRPVLAPSPTSGGLHAHTASIFIRNNCGDDNVCIPDLSLTVHMDVPEYLMGSEEDLVATAGVHNGGEDAFEAKLVVRVPRGAAFTRFLLLSNTAQDVTPICSATTKEDVEEVVCDMGNPLPAQANVSLQLVFQPKPDQVNETALEFHVRASSTNPEQHTSTLDNHIALALPVTVKTLIDIKGISWPEGPFDYNASRYGVGLVGEEGTVTHEKEVGPIVKHVYDITNGGPSDLPSALIFLLWPTRTLTEDPLLYLTVPPHVSQPAVCHSVPHVNYLGLEVDPSTDEGDPSLPQASSSDILKHEAKATEEHHRRRRHEQHRLQESLRTHRRTRSVWSGLDEELSCGPTNCTRVVCSVAPLRATQNIVVKVKSRLWVDTIQKVGMSEVKISSRLVVVAGEATEEGGWRLDDGVGVLDEGGGGGGGIWSKTVTTIVRTGPEEHRRSLKWVVVVGSILAGLLLLALLSTLLWAMGFFKRKRPQDKTETEPLNGNGFYGNGKS